MCVWGGIYKDVVLAQPTCGHCDEFTSTLPRQTTSLYHGPVVINLPGRPQHPGGSPDQRIYSGLEVPISLAIQSVQYPSLPLSVSTCHHHSLYHLINSSFVSLFLSVCCLLYIKLHVHTTSSKLLIALRCWCVFLHIR